MKWLLLVFWYDNAPLIEKIAIYPTQEECVVAAKQTIPEYKLRYSMQYPRARCVGVVGSSNGVVR